MSLVGDDVLDDLDGAENSHTSSTPIKMLPSPSTGSSLDRSLDGSDEAPPIPAHTMASMELVEQRKPAAPLPLGGGGGGGRARRSKSPVIQEPLSSTYDVVGAVTESVYEQPEPPKCELHIYMYGSSVVKYFCF
ncbi:MAG: hypothetical protein MJE68_30565 [Proteobacteria bacterium]|nr:hypothetical protein [Pseudomonadota bacterium]